MEMFKWQIENLIIFWECELEDCIANGEDSMIYESYEQCQNFINKLKALIDGEE